MERTIKIANVNAESITIDINGEQQQIPNTYSALKDILSQQKEHTFQAADKLYNIESINQANFYIVTDRAEARKTLPKDLADNLIGPENKWIDSLREELQEQPNITVGSSPGKVFHHYGWLIETFLLKIASKVGQKDPMRRLSFMTEAYQSSIRYLSYIQLAQVLSKPSFDGPIDFFNVETEAFNRYDFFAFLLQTNQFLESEDYFVPELEELIEELLDPQSELYETALFLEQQRSALILGEIGTDKNLDRLLTEYLTALVYWLRYISFIAQYRLVSIKDINLSYQLGTPKHFVHTYGELHGMYDENASDFNTRTLEEVFTYSRSVLLFRGSNIEAGLDKIVDSGSYLSLSPLIIDQSVYRDKETQTPEVYYYTGKEKRQYCYAQYRNELVLTDSSGLKSNKFIKIKRQNTQQPKWNKLYKQVDYISKHFKNGVL